MRRLMLAAAAAVVLSTAVQAQSILSAKAGLIHLMEGKVLISGQEVKQDGDVFLSVKEGETLSTERGRAEVLLNAGSYLRMGENTAVLLKSADLEDTRIEILSGNALIEVADLPKDTAVTLDMLGTSVALKKRGLYEFTADAPGRVRVYDGELSLKPEGAFAIKITEGREIALNALSERPVKFDKEETTALYRWGARRARYIASANATAAADSDTYRQALVGNYDIRNGYRGIWLFNSIFGMYTYLPLRGFGYSPFGGIVLYSPATIWTRYATPTVPSSGFDMGAAARSAVASPTYSSVGSSGGGAALPAASAPAVASPNTGGGGEAGRRR